MNGFCGDLCSAPVCPPILVTKIIDAELDTAVPERLAFLRPCTAEGTKDGVRATIAIGMTGYQHIDAEGTLSIAFNVTGKFSQAHKQAVPFLHALAGITV